MKNLYNIPHGCDAAILFKSGQIIYGKGFGVEGIKFGELCFNTSMTGYQEIITDPSYCDQIINFTFPHIGNVGCNQDDIEAAQVFAKGIIVRNKPTDSSNFRSESDFIKWLTANKVTGVYQVDTRAITRFIRDNGSKIVAIIYNEQLTAEIITATYNNLLTIPEMENCELSQQVTTKSIYEWHNTVYGAEQQITDQYKGLHIVAVDFGIKHNILRCLKFFKAKVTVVPAHISYNEIKALNPDGIFLSNGPGDPAETIKICGNLINTLIEEALPIFGICLGHQLIALALGAKTYHMKQGHRGANQPVLNLHTNKVEITSQNHGFCVDEKSLPKNTRVTHRSLFDGSLEGFELTDRPVFSVQYHPEASPGPRDSFYLFKQFYANVRGFTNKKVKLQA